MTNPAVAFEAPNVAETAQFLRRFAGMMSNGNNAAYLLNAAVLLETLAGRIIASSDEEQLWRYKYETLTEHSDHLEAECEALKRDIEVHLDLANSLLGERDTLATALGARDAKVSELNEAIKDGRAQLAAKSQAHEQAFAGFDREREALKAVVAARDEELARLRATFEGESKQFAKRLTTQEAKIAELQLDFGREREELRAQLASREGQIDMLRGEADRDREWSKARIDTLESKRAELRTALERLSALQPAAGHADGAGQPVSNGALDAATNASSHPGGSDTAEGTSVVPTATLRHARAQFEYLARESIRRGDVATQVMCELGAYTLELALKGGEKADHSPAGEIALSILEPGPAGPDTP
jgi:hypothetical protein